MGALTIASKASRSSKAGTNAIAWCNFNGGSDFPPKAEAPWPQPRSKSAHAL